jgi:transcriptional repressor NrdR
LEEVPLVVTKSHGGREPFDRAKIVAGITSASKGRPVSADQIEQLSIELEDHCRLQGNEITSAELGLEVLDRLRALDEVAYLRFASVYKNFDAASDFQRELVLLKKLQNS